MGTKITTELEVEISVTVARLKNGNVAILSTDDPPVLQFMGAGTDTGMELLASNVDRLITPRPTGRRSKPRATGIKTNDGAKEAIRAALLKTPLDLAALTTTVGFTSADRALKMITELEEAGEVQLEADGKYSLKAAGVAD